MFYNLHIFAPNFLGHLNATKGKTSRQVIIVLSQCASHKYRCPMDRAAAKHSGHHTTEVTCPHLAGFTEVKSGIHLVVSALQVIYPTQQVPHLEVIVHNYRTAKNFSTISCGVHILTRKHIWPIFGPGTLFC